MKQTFSLTITFFIVFLSLSFQKVWAQHEPLGPGTPVTINFDDIASNILLTNQYPHVTFSANGFSGGTGGFYDVYTKYTYYNNHIASVDNRYPYDPSYWNGPIYLNFALPVSNFSFDVLNSYYDVPPYNIGYIDVYVNYYYYGTYYLYGGGHPSITSRNSHLSSIQNITGIIIRNVYNGSGYGYHYPIFYDNFTFTPDLNLSITNTRVSGNLNGTTQNAMPAADIQLSANANRSGGTYSWSFTGPHSLSGGATNSPNVTIRATSVGTVVAKVTYTLNGVSTSASVTINASLPKITSFSQSQGSDVLLQPLQGSPCTNISLFAAYRLGCSDAENPGSKFTAVIQAPPNSISDPSQSGVKFVQAANMFHKRRHQGNTECLTLRTVEPDSGWALDTTDPYGAGTPIAETSVKWFSQGTPLTLQAKDYPFAEVGGNENRPDLDDDVHYVDDRFEIYVYYFTGAHANNPPFQAAIGLQGSQLPYARVEWKWGGQVLYVFNPTALAPYEKTFTNQPPTSNNAIAVGSVRPFREGGVLPGDAYPWNVCPGDDPFNYTANKIDWSRFFVERQYKDFFLREADYPGLNFWTSTITGCVFDTTCIDRKRVDVARAFFYSSEFIDKHPELNGQRGTHEYNAAFVMQCYRVFLRREPNAPPPTMIGADSTIGWGY